MFVCPDCYNKKLHCYTNVRLSKVGDCDNCKAFRYVERVYKLDANEQTKDLEINNGQRCNN